MDYFAAQGKIAIFNPFLGELGWEIMTWAPYCRRIAEDYDRAIICSFKGMKSLYKDFAEFIGHDAEGRGLSYPKMYRVDGKYFKYGDPLVKHDVLIHARGIRRKCNYNYKDWNKIVEMLNGLSVAFIGTLEDQYLEGFDDARGIELQLLMDLMAGSKIVVGVSSGIMHLAASCGTNLVVWGDDRTYFGETLEKRYKETWNPFNVNVRFLCAKDWQPEPEKVVKEIKNVA